MKTCEPVKASKIRDYFKCNPNLSIRDVAKRVNSFVWFVQQTMKRTGLLVLKVRQAHNRTDKQNTMTKSCSMKYREWWMQPKYFVIDNETYIEADA